MIRLPMKNCLTGGVATVMVAIFILVMAFTVPVEKRKVGMTLTSYLIR